jgi:hypothetical protein
MHTNSTVITNALYVHSFITSNFLLWSMSMRSGNSTWLCVSSIGPLPTYILQFGDFCVDDSAKLYDTTDYFTS